MCEQRASRPETSPVTISLGPRNATSWLLLSPRMPNISARAGCRCEGGPRFGVDVSLGLACFFIVDSIMRNMVSTSCSKKRSKKWAQKGVQKVGPKRVPKTGTRLVNVDGKARAVLLMGIRGASFWSLFGANFLEPNIFILTQLLVAIWAQFERQRLPTVLKALTFRWATFIWKQGVQSRSTCTMERWWQRFEHLTPSPTREVTDCEATRACNSGSEKGPPRARILILDRVE